MTTQNSVAPDNIMTLDHQLRTGPKANSQLASRLPLNKKPIQVDK